MTGGRAWPARRAAVLARGWPSGRSPRGPGPGVRAAAARRRTAAVPPGTCYFFPFFLPFGRLEPTQLIGHARGLRLVRADAVVLSACVQMPSLTVIDKASQDLGLPVLSAATATAREILALLAEEPVVPGAGAALARPVPAVP